MHDPFWELLATHNVTAALHIGDGHILKTDEWGGAPVFSGFKESLEVNVRRGTWLRSILPAITTSRRWCRAASSTGTRTCASARSRSGVLDRTAAYHLDIIDKSGGIMRSKDVYRLPEPPSFYIQRNVRVSAFDWEPVDEYIEMYAGQGIENVVCFASDFPHVEGGRELLIRFARRLERLGPEIMEKFFVSNGAYLIPE